MNSTSVPEITAEDLAAAIEAGERIQIIDLRSPSNVASGRITIVPDDEFHNILGSSLASLPTLSGFPLDLTRPTVAVCSRGNDSKIVTTHLNALGANVRSLSGGMTAWMSLLYPRPLQPPPSVDMFVQFDRMGKGALSYVLISSGDAVIVDPSRDFGPYLRCIDDAHARLVAVADTHVHADYISGAQHLAREARIPYYLHPADAVYPYDDTAGRLDFHPVRDGMSISFGRCLIDVHHTPGHSPGSVTYLIDQKVALTGDFLFIASVGRPDLAAKTEAWSALLWKSIQTTKETWPRDLMIYPAHYGTQAERRVDRTIGEELSRIIQRNGWLSKTSESEFMTWVQQRTSPFPDAYKTIKAINVGLQRATDLEADVLEFGMNECALGGK